MEPACFRPMEWQSAGTGAVRSITLTPLEATTGTANITLTVTDPRGRESPRARSR